MRTCALDLPSLITKGVLVKLPEGKEWFWPAKVLVVSYGVADCKYDGWAKSFEACPMLSNLVVHIRFPVFSIWLIWVCRPLQIE